MKASIAMIAAAVVLMMTLAACGGGGGSSGTPDTFSDPFPSVITVRFLRGGEPVTLDVLSYALTVDGEFCGSDVVGAAGVSEISVEWPPAGFPASCLRVGAEVEFACRISEEGGSSRELSARFLWGGQDITVDLNLDSPQ